MPTCNQFLAPNGKPSTLYAGLEQKYGPDKALQLWNWAKTLPTEIRSDVNILKGKMSYEYGGNARSGLNATTTIQAIRMNERTATTRYENDGNIEYWKNAKVGDVIEFSNNSGSVVKVQVTKPLTKLAIDTSAEEWSKKEGWSVDYFNSKVKPKLKKAWQLEYKYLPNGIPTPVNNLDENGEPTLEFVEKSMTTTPVVILSDFKTSSLEEFKKSLNAVYEKARNNPQQTFILPFKGEDIILGKNRKFTNAQLAALLDTLDAPVNVQYTKEMSARMQNLPKRFLSTVKMEEANPLQLNPAAVKRQMDLFFVQMRDENHQPTGEYFSPEKQDQAVDSIIYKFYNTFTAASANGSVNIERLRGEVYNEFNNVKNAWVEIANRPGASAEALQKVNDFNAILNAFYQKEEDNSLWNFAMQRLATRGIRMKNSQFEETNDIMQLPEETLDMEEGGGLSDFSENSLEMDLKDTASSRMKLFIMSTVESVVGKEVQPKEVKINVSNEATRIAIQNRWKRDLVLDKETASKLGFTPLSKLPKNLSQTNKDNKTQRTALFGNKVMRVTAVYPLTNEQITPDFAERISKEEGITPKPGDIYLKLEPYIQREDALFAQKNYIGLAQLADYETLFQDLTGLLSNREPSMEGYMQAMRESKNPNILRVLQKLEESDNHIKKEFVSVFSSHYQRMMMILFKKTKDGHLEGRTIDSNRSSEVRTILRFWQENQKTAEILTKNEVGVTVIDRNLANGLMEQLQNIYNTPAPRKSISEEEAVLKYGKRANEVLAEEDNKVQKERKKLENAKRDLFRTVMEVNGIVLDERAVEDLFKNIEKIGKKSSIKTIFGGFTEDGKPIGLIDVIISRLHSAADVVESEDSYEDEDLIESYKANNPLYTENTAMNLLAKVQLNYTPQIYSQTHKNSENKTIYGYGLNTSLSHAVRKLTEDLKYRQRLENSYFSKRSWLLSKLDNSEWHRDRFQMTYMDGLKNEYGSRDGVIRTKMSSREQWMTVLSLFQNKANRVTGHMVSLTHSDKTKTPVYLNVPKIKNSIRFTEDGPRIDKGVVELAFSKIFMAEYDRMIHPGGENIKGYAQGKQHYFLFPKFNKTEMRKLVSKGVLSEGEYNAIWNKDGSPQSVENILFKPTAMKLIEMQLQEMVKDTISQWQSSKLLEAGLPGSADYFKAVMAEAAVNPEDATDDIKIYLAAADYVVNSVFFNTSLIQLFYGDMALTWKGSVEGTMVEYGKRLAKDIAPGRDGEFSHSPTYITVTAADYKPAAKELAQIKGYDEVEATDAQEVTTVEEHLNVMYAYGRITEKQWARALGIIEEGHRLGNGYYKFPADLESIIMQPMKPVATGLRDAVDGVMNFDYVKSSAFPLYPPVVKGMELDKLRVAMEKSGVNRVNFASAKKIGAPVKQVTIFSKDGTINPEVFESQEWLQDSRQSLDRSEFRIQQDVPYDEEKDAILTVSQMNKLITEGIATVEGTFTYQGREVNGTELKAIKEDIRKQLINQSLDKFLKKVGAERDGNRIIFKDKKKFYQLLAKEAQDRAGYTMNDVLAVTSFVGDELVLPLAFSPSAARFEGLMMSMIKKIVQIKMPGKSFIQASPAGFKTMQTWEESKLDENDIVWTKPLDGELKTAHKDADGKIQPAQVLVGFNYFTNSGKRINIQDFIKEENGKKMLDTEKIPAELFQLIGARIPNQGHSSMLPIEIVGFLPQQMGDMIVVPAAITKQMGADFDVDKLFTYHRPYKFKAGKLTTYAEAELILNSKPISNEIVDELYKRAIETVSVTDIENYAKSKGIQFTGNVSNEDKYNWLKSDLNWLFDGDTDLLKNFRYAISSKGIEENTETIKSNGGTQEEVTMYSRVAKYVVENFEPSNETAKVDLKEELQTSYFDVHWSVLTNPAMFEKMMSPLDKDDLKKEAELLSPSKEVPYYVSPAYQLNDFESMKGAKVLVGQTSLALTHNAVMQDKKIRLMCYEILAPISAYGLQLTHLSGYGQSEYNGEVRTKADNIQIQQSESVDHAKNRIIDKINLDPNTSAASLAMSRLQTADQGKPGEPGFVPGRALPLSFNARMLMQPIIREWAAEMSQSSDTLSTSFSGNPREAVFNSLLEKYTDKLVEEFNEDKEAADEFLASFLKNFESTPDSLLESIQMKPGKEFYARQIAALTLFREFDEVGKQLVTLQSITAQDTRGAGKDMLSVATVIENRVTAGIGNESRFIGGIDQLYDGTEVGTTYDSTIQVADDLYSDELPYRAMLPIYKNIMEHSGKTDLSDDLKRTIFNAMRSLTFSDNKLGLFADAYKERMRLLFSAAGRKSLARRVADAKVSWGKSNYLLQRLQTIVDPDGIQPDVIEYNAAKAALSSDVENQRAWLAMLTSEDEVQRNLGIDLVRYLYATGGLQNARNFVKYIPWAAIEGSEIAEGIRKMTADNMHITKTALSIEQIFQHNPSMAKQLSENLKETGREYEEMPDSFELPTLNFDMMDANPARNLLVTITNEVGQKVQTYPNYLSVRSNNKWILFKKEGVTNNYYRIDTLGNSKVGILEYSTSGKGLARSVFTDNRAPLGADFENAMLSYNSPQAIRTQQVMRQVGLMNPQGNYQDMMNALSVIAADTQQPSHIRVVASMLQSIQQNSEENALQSAISGVPGELGFRFHFSERNDIMGNFNSGMNVLELSTVAAGNKVKLAEVMLHELMHYHTALLSLTTESETQLRNRKISAAGIVLVGQLRDRVAENPQLKDKVDAIESLRKQVLDKFETYAVSSIGWDKYQNETKNFKGRLGGLYYSLHNSAEFIAHVMTDPELMGFLNGIPYQGKKTMLDHLKELFAQLWGSLMEAMNVHQGTMLEESIKRTLDLVMYNQMVDTKLMTTKTMADFSIFYNGFDNAKVNSENIDMVDRVIGKLEEQRQDLINSYTGITSAEQRHDKRRKIEQIEADMDELRESRDLMKVADIGEKHLKWVMQVDSRPDPNPNEIMAAIRIGNMWRGIIDILYGAEATTVDSRLADLAAKSGNAVHSLISKSKDVLTDRANGVIRLQDWNEENLSDVGPASAQIRSLSSAANSRVIQHIASFMETVGRQEEEDVYRLMQELTKLEKEMAQYAGGKKNLHKVYDKLTQKGNEWGMALQYSQNWFDWRSSSIAKRNAQLSRIDKTNEEDVLKNRKKRVVWQEFWKEVNSKAAFVDTTVFFEAETGEFKKDIAKPTEALAAQVGKDHVEAVLARAQERYLRYVEDRTTFFDLLDGEVAAGEKTAEEAEQEKLDFQNRHSPNVFFDNVNQKRTFSSASEKYVTMAPKSETKEFWNEKYQEIMNDPILNDFYKRYGAIIDRLMSYLPKTIQDKSRPGFLPIVRKSLMSDLLDLKQYVPFTQQFNEKFITSLTAAEWQEEMSDKAFSRIPIEFVKESEAAVSERSKDLVGIARIFGMMALHYKHFSAAKDVIDMGEVILKEVERTRIDGASQIEQNGRVVTVKKGLRNALDALQYMKEYMVYRKPRALEFSMGGKVYAEKTATGRKFSLNPAVQKRMSDEVRRLNAEKIELEKKYINQEIEMSEEEYSMAMGKIDEELAKYEGYTLYGSKIGDKLIGINQLKALSYNPFSAVANLSFGLVSVAIHANGGADFTWKESGAAFKLMLNATKAKVGFKNETADKILNILDRLNVIGDYVDSRYGKKVELRDDKAGWKKMIEPYAMLRTTDVFMKGVTTLAVLLNRKVTVTTAEGEKQISVWEALDNDGNWNEELYGKRPEWYSDDVTQQTEWDKLRNRVVRVNMVIHGNTDKNSPKLFNKHIIGRLLGQFRLSWLPEGWYNRFGDEKYDEYLERTVKGRYRTLGQLGIGGSARVLGRQFANLLPGVKLDLATGITMADGRKLSESAVDIENMRRNFAELSFFLSMKTAILMLRFAQDDDDEKDPALQVLINQLIRAKTDIEFYASPEVFDVVTRTPIPAFQVLTDYGKLMNATGKVILDDDYEFDEWLLRVTKAGLPIPQATLVNKTKYMMERDLEDLR